MSLFELENTLSFDEYIETFDAERVAKVHGFCRLACSVSKVVLSIILGVR